jgi:hypothetical protein
LCRRSSNRVPPLLSAAGGAGLRRRAWCRHPSVVTDRQHHLLPRTAVKAAPWTIRYRRHSQNTRRERRCDVALRSARGMLGDPESPPSRVAPRRTWRSSISSCPPTRRPRSTNGHGPRGGPEPDAIILGGPQWARSRTRLNHRRRLPGRQPAGAKRGRRGSLAATEPERTSSLRARLAVSVL